MSLSVCGSAGTLRKDLQFQTAFQLVFAEIALVSTELKGFSVAFINGKHKFIWIVHESHLFHGENHGLRPEQKEFAVVKYFGIILNRDNAYEILGCVCLF